jgi:hypothetical protein
MSPWSGERAPLPGAVEIRGPLEMYLAAGFSIAREAERVLVVRRSFTAPV